MIKIIKNGRDPRRKMYVTTCLMDNLEKYRGKRGGINE